MRGGFSPGNWLPGVTGPTASACVRLPCTASLLPDDRPLSAYLGPLSHPGGWEETEAQRLPDGAIRWSLDLIVALPAITRCSTGGVRSLATLSVALLVL